MYARTEFSCILGPHLKEDVLVPACGEVSWALGTPGWPVWRDSSCLTSCLPPPSGAQGESFLLCRDGDSPFPGQGASCCCPSVLGLVLFSFSKAVEKHSNLGLGSGGTLVEGYGRPHTGVLHPLKQNFWKASLPCGPPRERPASSGPPHCSRFGADST